MKSRLDKLIYDRQLADSREKAKALIMAGKVFVNKVKIDKPGTLVDESYPITITGEKCPYVSRGGFKLEKALHSFSISLKDKVVADIGASTGGFTDCALQHGAKKVYAVDVGYGQLDWVLRNHPQVVSMERTNARYLKNDDFEDAIEFVTIDVAFISLTKILPAVTSFLKENNGEVVALIKPQFEAGREKIGKKGVVKDKEVHKEVIRNIIDFSLSKQFVIKGLTFSPIKGPEGNIEYLLWLKNNGESIDYDIGKTVDQAHDESAK